MMDKDRNYMTEKILKLTLEIIYLLTGEDYAPVINSTLHVTRSSISHTFGRSRRTQSQTMDHSSSQVYERKNDDKILDLTSKITRLLTGEVPIRYGDTLVCFTVEEWEYVEGHKELYKCVLMEEQNNHSKDLNKEETVVEDQALPSTPCTNKAASDIQTKVGRKASKWRKPPKRQAKYISKHKDKLSVFKSKPPENVTIISGSSRHEDGNFTRAVTNSATNTHNPCLSSGVKPVNNENNTPSDHTQGKNTDCQTEQQLSCIGGNSTGDYVEVNLSYPEILPCIQESPTATSYTQVQYVYTPIKEETVHTEADNYGPTQYLSTDNQESSWQKTNDPGANIYAVGHARYTPTHCKKESVLCEEENRIHSIYISPDDMQTQNTPKQVKMEPISQEEGYELYIPTDCTQRFHTSAPREAMNRVKAAAKTNKRFSLTKYRDWNKEPENTSYMNHKSTQFVDGMYVCSTCEKSFTSHFGLVKHQAMHNGNKVSCPQCGKLFFYKSSLVIHQRIHTGEKLFTCPVCNKCFTNNSNLIVHQRIHTGEKPFVCSECGKRFAHKGHLNRHLRTHETEKSATSIKNYVNNSLQDHDHWSLHKINRWSHNIYGTGPSTYTKSV